MKKRMLEIVKPDPFYANSAQAQKPIVYINASSVEVIQSCMRKAQYLLNEELIKDSGSSDAQAFGTGIHAGLAYFYSKLPSLRDFNDMVAAFENEAGQIRGVPDDDKRSIANGRKILKGYFDTYKDDPWVVYTDEEGAFVERKFELHYADCADYSVYVHGTIDAILLNTDTGELAVVDHKTASTLGESFFQGVKPRTQFALYSWAANQLGVTTGSFMLNGIQVAKTKTQFARVMATYVKEDFEELKASVLESVDRYWKAKQSDKWPMSAQSLTCSAFGKCSFLEICQAPKANKQFVKESLYGKKQ
jgi:hypothetical protein